MPLVTETVGKPLQSVLDLGVNTLSSNQTVTFTQYVRVILPMDGFIFWVKADLLSESALYNAYKYNQLTYDALPTVITPAKTITIRGSLHYSTVMKQDEDATNPKNEIIFTAESEVMDFNAVGSNVLYLSEVDGVQYTFSRQGSFYLQANLYHYRGIAVNPVMGTQVINSIAELDPSSMIVSNSLPLWLTLDRFFPMYPSYAVLPNLAPPYASVHIEPKATESIGSAPVITSTTSHYQLVTDTARIIIYGVRNNQILDWMDYVFQYTLDYETMGIMNMPTIRDEKRTQVEITALAIKKSVEFKINYYQSRVNDIARQMILSAIPSYILGD